VALGAEHCFAQMDEAFGSRAESRAGRHEICRRRNDALSSATAELKACVTLLGLALPPAMQPVHSFLTQGVLAFAPSNRRKSRRNLV
jgi:hypothetical protein